MQDKKIIHIIYLSLQLSVFVYLPYITVTKKINKEAPQ